MQNLLILQLISGAGYGSRTRLNGLGSRCNTDIPTLHIQFHRVTFSVTILDFLISETRKPLKIQDFFPGSCGAWEAFILPMNYARTSLFLYYTQITKDCKSFLPKGTWLDDVKKEKMRGQSTDDPRIQTYRPTISPLVEMVMTCWGIILPLWCSAVRTAFSSPPQQGTCIRTTVTLRISF